MSQIIKRIFCIIVLACFMSGCANYSYIRSDIILDRSKVSNIYMMPIIESVQIDGVYLQKNQRKNYIHSKVIQSIGMLYDYIENNLTQKGYNIKVDRRRFVDLEDKENEQDMRDSILSATNSVMYDDFDFTVSGNAEQGLFTNLLKLTKEPGVKSSDILINKTIKCFQKLKIDANTVMYFYVETYIAKRFLGIWIREESYLTYKIDMVSLKEQEVIFSFKRTYEKTDLLSRRKMMVALDDILTHVPMRL